MSFVCTRHFMDWDQPTLARAAAWIVDRHTTSHHEADLTDLDLVVPGRRAGRGLLGALVDLVAQRGLALIPPLILTPSELPAALIGIPGRHASRTAQRLAWIEALRSCDRKYLQFLFPRPPESDRIEEWTGPSAWIEGVSRSLADAGLRLAQVPELVAHLLDETESARWILLGQLQSHYEQLLNQRGVVDDRLVVLDRVFGKDPAPPKHPGRRVVLVGVAELGSVGLRTIEQSECVVDALVFAPESMRDRFDALGCVRAKLWASDELDIPEEGIVFSQSNDSMCERALSEIARGEDPIDASSAVLGLADESLISTLRRKAILAGDDGTGSGVTIHSPAGIPSTQTTPGQLIRLIQTHLSEHTFDSLTALVRHPDFERALAGLDGQDERSGAWWIESLDVIRQDHVLSNASAMPRGIDPKHALAVGFVLRGVEGLLQPLESDEELPIDHWAERLIDTLINVYQLASPESLLPAGRGLIEGLQAVRQAIDEVIELRTLETTIPSCSHHAALGFVLDRMSEMINAENIESGSIEAVGWLELLHDPAPLCVVVGMSESCVPGSITHDPLLPGSLREALGMPSNTQRLGRDAYMLSAINASRNAAFMCARMGDKNDPITPSRLLLRASGVRLAHRIGRFVEPKLDTPVTLKLQRSITPGHRDDFRPSLRVHDGYTPPDSMTVTEFDSYLRSPAQWYLERHLRLKELDTRTRELSPSHLGSLVHSVLEGFSIDDSTRDLDDPLAINESLEHLLETHARSMFGVHPAAAVMVQIELLRYRLGWFAKEQSKRRQQGWRIVRWEWTPSSEHPPSLDVDGVPMALRGKIDRIDHHESSGRWSIIDYKTGHIQDPRKAHQRRDRWCKLQLPLYRHMVREIIGGDPIELGYMGLPSSENEDACAIANWDQSELSLADEEARRIVREIRELSEGDRVEMGEHAPDSGHLGFITGQRFEVGGAEFGMDELIGDDPESSNGDSETGWSR